MANNFFSRLQEGLSKTRDNITKGFDNVFSGFSSIDEDFYEELEEILIMGDIGVNATSRIMDKLREEVKKQRINNPNDCRELLISIIREQMKTDENAYDFEDKKIDLQYL